MYGQTLIEFVQGPGEVIFLPHGLTHAVLNIHDNVAYTENFFYVSALPGKLKILQLSIRIEICKTIIVIFETSIYMFLF